MRGLAAVIRDPAANATLCCRLVRSIILWTSSPHGPTATPDNIVAADQLDNDRVQFSIPIIAAERAACLDIPGRQKEMQKSQATAHR